MHGQRLHAAEAGRPAGVPQVADEGVGGLEAAGELEGEHAAEAAHLIRGQRVLRVGRQAGVVHPGHGGMALQRLGEGLAVVVVPGHAQRQSAQTAQQQPGIEGSEHGAGEQGDVPDPVQELGRAGHHSGGDVGVAVEVLGGAVPDQVDAEVGRSLVQRSREGVVREGQHVMRAGQVGDGAKVGDLQQRIARRLHQDQPGLRGQRLLECLRVGLVHLGGRNAEPRQEVQQHRGRAAVGGLLSDDVVTRGHQGQHGRGQGGHPGRRDHRRLGVLELRDHGGDLRVVRVAVAGVEVLAPWLDRRLRERLRVLGPEGGRLVDRPRDRPAGMDVPVGVNDHRADARHGSPSRAAGLCCPRVLDRGRTGQPVSATSAANGPMSGHQVVVAGR